MTTLVRADLSAVARYERSAFTGGVDLSDNTNLWGPCPAALEAIAAPEQALVSRYPDTYADPLRVALAQYLDVDPRNVITGCGSDDVLDALLRAAVTAGDALVIPTPTFHTILTIAQANGLRIVETPLVDQRDAPLEPLLTSGAQIMYLCSPNNPTGTSIAPETLRQILDNFAGIVIVDEAYAEFSGQSFVPLVSEFDNLVVVRTFSKAFGLAGLRIGYAIAGESIVAAAERTRGVFKVSGLAERAGVAALTDGLAWMRECVKRSVAARNQLLDEFRQRQLAPTASQANFVLVPLLDAVRIAADLRERGFAVRLFSSLPSIGPALRITVGPDDVMERFLTRFDEVRS